MVETARALLERAAPEEADEVEAAVRFINERTTVAGVALAREVGNYVLDSFFGGDYEAFSDPRRNKPLSFRRLLERPELLLPPTTLYTFVRVAHQLEELPTTLAERLSLSHHRALLSVRDTSERTVLARHAVDQGWTKEELERRVRARQPASNRGRKRLPACVKATTRIAQALEEAFSEETVPEELRQLGEERLRGTLERIEESLIRLQWLQATVQEAMDETATATRTVEAAPARRQKDPRPSVQGDKGRL